MTQWNAELYRERSSLQQTMATEVLQALEVSELPAGLHDVARA